jgi:hypothetical protein
VSAAAVLAHAGHSHDDGGAFNYEWISFGVVALGAIYAAYLVFSKRR